MIYRLDEPADVTVRSGRTFALPAGYYAYAGSAFGAGGVRARTDRHAVPGTVRHWNIDYLKAIADPVEVWWTHDEDKRECTWSSVLARCPGVSCLAPGFGSNDCHSIRAAGAGSLDGLICVAHLYHFGRRPVARDFVRRLSGLVPGPASVSWRALDERRLGGTPDESAGRPTDAGSLVAATGLGG